MPDPNSILRPVNNSRPTLVAFAAILSLLFLAYLISSYFLITGIQFVQAESEPTPSVYVSSSRVLQLGQGTLYFISLQRTSNLPRSLATDRPPGFRAYAEPCLVDREDLPFSTWRFLFAHRTGPTSIGQADDVRFSMPSWPLIIPCLIFPIIWYRRYRRRPYRLRHGLCLHCGYDLRATPDRCPECGARTTPLTSPSPVTA